MQEADEDIRVGKSRQQFVAQSVIVEYAPSTVVSWTSTPPGRPEPRRIQWWFRLEGVEHDTRVQHQVQVDFGPVMNIALGPIYLAKAAAG